MGERVGSDDERRFADGAWWRNRRAVVVTDHGLVVEHRCGRPRLVPWANVVALHHRSARRLCLDTTRGRLRFDARLAGLAEFAAAVQERQTAWRGRVRGGEVLKERWRGLGQLRAVWRTERRRPDRVAPLAVLGIVLAYTAIFCMLLAWDTASAELIGLATVASIMVWSRLKARGSQRPVDRWEVLVTPQAVTVSSPGLEWHEAWDDILGFETTSDGLRVYTVSGKVRGIPRLPGLGPLFRPLDRPTDFATTDAQISAAALSRLPAEPLEPGERGLSRLVPAGSQPDAEGSQT